MSQYRQGDLLIERVEPSARPTSGLRKRWDETHGYVLAYGEVTGHAHRVSVLDAPTVVIPPAEDIDFEEDANGTIWLRVKGERPVAVRHEEHAAIELAPGDYRVTRQREYVAEDDRSSAWVAD